jgi:hypothetical protein
LGLHATGFVDRRHVKLVAVVADHELYL